jgi:hypothetical protein
MADQPFGNTQCATIIRRELMMVWMDEHDTQTVEGKKVFRQMLAELELVFGVVRIATGAE